MAKKNEQTELERLRAENAALKQQVANPTRHVELVVSQKGAVQINGLRRFPVTFYAEEWDVLSELVKSGKIAQFVKENAARLTFKKKN